MHGGRKQRRGGKVKEIRFEVSEEGKGKKNGKC